MQQYAAILHGLLALLGFWCVLHPLEELHLQSPSPRARADTWRKCEVEPDPTTHYIGACVANVARRVSNCVCVRVRDSKRLHFVHR